MAAKKHTVGVGIVGMGFMGLTHLRAARRLRGGHVVAIATSDPRKAGGDFSSVGGNFGPGGSREDLRSLRVHPTLDGILQDRGVDLVDICLPTFLHAPAALRALEARKHVLVEKPIALDPADGRRLLRAARARRRFLLVAQVLKFSPEFALLAEAIADRRWGKLRALHLRRLIAPPAWSEGSWLSEPSRSGGMAVDLHIHDTDFVVSLLGRPRAVTSSALTQSGRMGEIDFIRTTYHFRGRRPPLVSSEAGWLNAPALPFEHGYDAFFEATTLHFNSTRTPAPVLYHGCTQRPLRLRRADGFQREIQAAVDSVRRGEADRRLAALSALTALEVCLAEQHSARTGKTVEL